MTSRSNLTSVTLSQIDRCAAYYKKIDNFFKSSLHSHCQSCIASLIHGVNAGIYFKQHSGDFSSLNKAARCNSNPMSDFAEAFDSFSNVSLNVTAEADLVFEIVEKLECCLEYNL